MAPSGPPPASASAMRGDFPVRVMRGSVGTFEWRALCVAARAKRIGAPKRPDGGCPRASSSLARALGSRLRAGLAAGLLRGGTPAAHLLHVAIEFVDPRDQLVDVARRRHAQLLECARHAFLEDVLQLVPLA